MLFYTFTFHYLNFAAFPAIHITILAIVHPFNIIFTIVHFAIILQ